MNETHFCALVAPDMPCQSSRRAAVQKASKWDVGEVITIRFLEGEQSLRDRVMAVAREWTKPGLANLKLEVVGNAPSDIRIAFRQGAGSWSYLGNTCRKVLEPASTMNYGWLTKDSTDAVLRPVVLHEFGHALGMIHEHQSPTTGIKWNRPAVIKDLSGPPNNWDEAKIEHNIFKKYDPNDIDSTLLDKDSIMMYPIPKSWTLDGFQAGFNTAISELDRHLISNIYPG